MANGPKGCKLFFSDPNHFDEQDSVIITESTNVADLRRQIIQVSHPRYANIPASKLSLYQVDIPFLDYSSLEHQITEKMKSLRQPLFPGSPITNYYKLTPAVNMLHIIVVCSEASRIAGWWV